MEENIKKLWLSKIKAGKIAVVESPYAPNNHNCIWLKQDTMYVYGNRGWEELSSSGGDTPEPEPLDPKYVRTPIEFTEFEIKEASVGGEPFSGAISNMVSVQEEASEFQEGSTITIKIPGQEDLTSSDTPIYVTAETTGEEAGLYVTMQMFLSEVYPNDTIEVVSVTGYQTEQTALVIAKVNEENKTFTFMTRRSVPEGLALTVNSPAEPVVNETNFLTHFPQDKYPVEGFTPIVVFKQEDAGENKTYANVGFYKLSDDPYDAFMEFDDGNYHYYPAINASNNNRYSGLAPSFGFLSTFPSVFPTERINSLLPAGNQYMGYAFGNDYEVDIAKYPEDINKRIIVILLKETHEVSGTGLSDEDILKDIFDVDDISSITSDYLGLYKRSNLG